MSEVSKMVGGTLSYNQQQIQKLLAAIESSASGEAYATVWMNLERFFEKITLERATSQAEIDRLTSDLAAAREQLKAVRERCEEIFEAYSGPNRSYTETTTARADLAREILALTTPKEQSRD